MSTQEEARSTQKEAKVRQEAKSSRDALDMPQTLWLGIKPLKRSVIWVCVASRAGTNQSVIILGTQTQKGLCHYFVSKNIHSLYSDA